jgi:hypothetical protein
LYDFQGNSFTPNPFSLETTFGDYKDILAASRQHVRFRGALVGAVHTCLWKFTMTEATTWDREGNELVDRRTSPWIDPSRRPSRADKHQAWPRDCWPKRFVQVYSPGSPTRKFERLLALAVCEPS